MSRRRYVLAALGVVAALSALGLLSRALSPTPTATPTSTPSADASPTPSGEDVDEGSQTPPPTWLALSHGESGEEPVRHLLSMAPSVNPFAPNEPPGPASTQTPDLRLEGIAEGTSTIALISGRRVPIGATVDGFQLLSAGGRQADLYAPEHGHLRLYLQGPAPVEAAEP